jgi:hypothetical protein
MRLRLVCGSDNRPIVPSIPQEFGGRPRRAPTRKPLFPAAFLMGRTEYCANHEGTEVQAPKLAL